MPIEQLCCVTTVQCNAADLHTNHILKSEHHNFHLDSAIGSRISIQHLERTPNTARLAIARSTSSLISGYEATRTIYEMAIQSIRRLLFMVFLD